MARAAAATRNDESRPPLVKMPSGTSLISSRATAPTSTSRSCRADSRVFGAEAAAAASQYGRTDTLPASATSTCPGGSLWMPSSIVCGAGT